ncbi:MAG: hypothetical protein AABX51_08655 [Nanoarchaeota archaeon]
MVVSENPTLDSIIEKKLEEAGEKWSSLESVEIIVDMTSNLFDNPDKAQINQIRDMLNVMHANELYSSNSKVSLFIYSPSMVHMMEYIGGYYNLVSIPLNPKKGERSRTRILPLVMAKTIKDLPWDILKLTPSRKSEYINALNSLSNNDHVTTVGETYRFFHEAALRGSRIALRHLSPVAYEGLKDVFNEVGLILPTVNYQTRKGGAFYLKQIEN